MFKEHVTGVPTYVHICTSIPSNDYYLGFADNSSPNADLFIRLGPFEVTEGCHVYSVSSMPIVQGTMPLFVDSTIWVGFTRHIALDPYSNTEATGACHHEIILDTWNSPWPDPQVNSGCVDTTDVDAIWIETDTDVSIMSDILSRVYGAGRANVDILALVDQLAHAIGKPLTDQLQLADILMRSLIAGRGNIDVLTLSDLLLHDVGEPFIDIFTLISKPIVLDVLESDCWRCTA